MTTLTENPYYIQKFDKEAAPYRQHGAPICVGEAGGTSPTQAPTLGLDVHAPIHVFQWRRGESQQLIEAESTSGRRWVALKNADI